MHHWPNALLHSTSPRPDHEPWSLTVPIGMVESHEGLSRDEPRDPETKRIHRSRIHSVKRKNKVTTLTSAGSKISHVPDPWSLQYTFPYVIAKKNSVNVNFKRQIDQDFLWINWPRDNKVETGRSTTITNTRTFYVTSWRQRKWLDISHWPEPIDLVHPWWTCQARTRQFRPVQPDPDPTSTAQRELPVTW